MSRGRGIWLLWGARASGGVRRKCWGQWDFRNVQAEMDSSIELGGSGTSFDDSLRSKLRNCEKFDRAKNKLLARKLFQHELLRFCSVRLLNLRLLT